MLNNVNLLQMKAICSEFAEHTRANFVCMSPYSWLVHCGHTAKAYSLIMEFSDCKNGHGVLGKLLENRRESQLEGVENRSTPQRTLVLKLPVFQQGPLTFSWHPSQHGPQKSSKEPLTLIVSHDPVWPCDTITWCWRRKKTKKGKGLSSLNREILWVGGEMFCGGESYLPIAFHSVEEDWAFIQDAWC